MKGACAQYIARFRAAARLARQIAPRARCFQLPLALTPARVCTGPRAVRASRAPAVTVKWGKETYDVDVDTSLPALVFKMQLFTLTGVPPERQKIMGVKNPPLKARARHTCRCRAWRRRVALR
jgi:hypothetical protein